MFSQFGDRGRGRVIAIKREALDQYCETHELKIGDCTYHKCSELISSDYRFVKHEDFADEKEVRVIASRQHESLNLNDFNRGDIYVFEMRHGCIINMTNEVIGPSDFVCMKMVTRLRELRRADPPKAKTGIIDISWMREILIAAKKAEELERQNATNPINGTRNVPC